MTPRMARAAKYVGIGAAVVLAVLGAARLRTEQRSMKNCKQLDEATLEKRRAQLEARPRYVPGEKGRATAQLHFSLDLDADAAAQSLFVISSNLADAAVYRGPYQPSIAVPFDESLSKNDAYDNLEFWLLDVHAKQICWWVGERGHPFWRPGARIEVELLGEVVFDKDGLGASYRVTIR